MKVTLSQEGQPRITIDVEPGATVQDALSAVGRALGGGTPHINGIAATPETVVNNGDSVNVARAAKGNA